MPRLLVKPETLFNAVDGLLAGQDARTLQHVHARLTRVIDEAGPDAFTSLNRRLVAAGAGWDYYPPDPLARRIHHVLADLVLDDASVVSGIEHVHAVAGRPVAIVANHLSYSDANMLDVMLCRSGGASLADRLTAMAGPKVYSSIQRRFSSLCFGTIKTPQSSGLSSEEAVMNARDVARTARRVIEIANDRLREGDALLLFPEGSRSRTTGMQQTLTAVSRYFDAPDLQLLPVGITGTETFYPIGSETVQRVRAVVSVGAPIEAHVLVERANGDRRLAMDAIGLAIAAQLPVDYRGVYGDDAPDLDEARVLWQYVGRTS
jgi:1-acyl-sn-glycerol-3-phosphate acyltransferase